MTPNAPQDLLVESIRMLQRGRVTFEKSFVKCQKITAPFSIEDDEMLESIEAFTSLGLSCSEFR